MNVNSASRISNNTPLQVVVAPVRVVAHYIHNSNILYRLKDIVAVRYLVWERIVCAFLLQTNVVAVGFHLYTYLVRTYEVEVYIYLQFVNKDLCGIISQSLFFSRCPLFPTGLIHCVFNTNSMYKTN